MRTRQQYIAKNFTVSDTATQVFFLTGLGPIQDIRVKYRSTNGATSNTLAKLNGMVSKIEILDGSDLHESLSFQEWQAYDFFMHRHMPYQDLSAGAAVVVQEEIVIPFGRFMGDGAYYYDTNRYKNPIIRLTHAMTISATAGFATGTTAVDVIARVIERDPPPYAGFFMRKEQRSVSTAASGDDQAILALDYPYESLLVQALKTTILPDAIITNFKLLIDNGRSIPIDMVGTDLLAQNEETYGRAFQTMRPLSDTSFTWLSDIYFQGGAVFDRPGATGKGIISTQTAESVTGTMTTGQAADGLRILVNGFSPQACFFLPFHPHEMTAFLTDGYIDPAKEGIKELKLLSTQGTSGANLKICSSQLRQ